MNKRIFGRFKENKKWKDYFNFKSFECKMSFILMVIIIFSFKFLDVYNKFGFYITSLQNITIYVAQALIGMLGIILAGIAIIVSVLNKDSLSSIEKINEKGSIQRVLVSFEFLIFNIGIGIFVFFLINLILYSHQKMIPIFWFYFVLAVISYFLAFIIFYTISLTGNCIRVFFINDLYTNISLEEKGIYEIANEVRIDYLLYCLHKTSNLSPKELMEDLDKFVDSSNVPDKEAIKKYLKNYYDSPND
jgi:hypothetical protein